MYECDAYGHVNNANYLRYMQEAAIEASAALGYDTAYYTALGHHWLIRETEIEYLRPLLYGDTVEVKTWVADFRRVRSRRNYELRSLATGELAAQASTDWVYVNSATGEPGPVPPEMAATFLPPGPARLPAAPRRRDHFPPPPPGVFRSRRRVAFFDLDPARHVNNAVYLSYVEDCGMAVLAARGWTLAQMWQAGFAILPRRHHLTYRTPVQLDDEIEISTWVSDVKRATALRHYTLTRVADAAPVAEVHTLYVWVDRETLKPIRIPAGFMADFRSNVAEEDADAVQP
jgi:acyl-CoA thioester hydrolase